MSTPFCETCGKPVPDEDINVAKNIAYCRGCGTVYELSSFAESDECDENAARAVFDISRPPAGTWFRETPPGAEFGASCRSWGAAAATLFMALFWNGIVSVFVSLAVSGTLVHFNIVAKENLPVKINGMPTGGALIFLWLFLTPFIAIGFGLFAAFFMSLFGTVKFTIQGGALQTSAGIGKLARRRTIDLSNIKKVETGFTGSRQNGSAAELIKITGHDGKEIKLGSQLRGARREFLIFVLRSILPGNNRQGRRLC